MELMSMKLSPSQGFKNVYDSTEMHLITLKKLELENNGIPAIIFDQRDSSYNAFGRIYLSVPIQFYDEALEILQDED